jgi:hypothetical protein
MIPDKLLINLKIISKIQKNGRITRSYDGIISLENEIFYQSIKRFFSNDSRRQATFEINSVITETIDILHHIINSKYMHKNFYQTDEYIKNCENLSLILTELEAAKAGIENLKFTYQNDQNTSSQIDIIILKINTTIKDFTQKLHYFQSYLTGSYQNNYTTSLQQNYNIDNRQKNYTSSLQQNYDLHSVSIDNGQNNYTEQNTYNEENTQEDDNESI